MTLYRWRSMTLTMLTLLLAFVLLSCGSGSPQTQVKPAPLPPSPTPGPGQLLLENVSQALNTARTLHGQFDLNITGQTLHGTIQSEIWNASLAKNRTEIQQSTVSQVVAGSITITDGKQIWQYDPIKKVVYNGPAPKNVNGTPATGEGAKSALVESGTKHLHTQHRDITVFISYYQRTSGL